MYELACQRNACVSCFAPRGVLLYPSDDILASLRWYKYLDLPSKSVEQLDSPTQSEDNTATSVVGRTKQSLPNDFRLPCSLVPFHGLD